MRIPRSRIAVVAIVAVVERIGSWIVPMPEVMRVPRGIAVVGRAVTVAGVMTVVSGVVVSGVVTAVVACAVMMSRVMRSVVTRRMRISLGGSG